MPFRHMSTYIFILHLHFGRMCTRLWGRKTAGSARQVLVINKQSATGFEQHTHKLLNRTSGMLDNLKTEFKTQQHNRNVDIKHQSVKKRLSPRQSTKCQKKTFTKFVGHTKKKRMRDLQKKTQRNGMAGDIDNT